MRVAGTITNVIINRVQGEEDYNFKYYGRRDALGWKQAVKKLDKAVHDGAMGRSAMMIGSDLINTGNDPWMGKALCQTSETTLGVKKRIYPHASRSGMITHRFVMADSDYGHVVHG